MTRPKQLFTLLLSVALCAAVIPGGSANAIAITSDTIAAPEGYTLVNDAGALNWNAWNGETYRPYLLYQNIQETSTRLYLTSLFRYNYTQLVVPMDAYDTYAAIYGDYAAELDFECYEESKTTQGAMTITLYDEQTPDGTYSVDPADYPSKETALIALCDQLQEAGAITSATYAAVITTSGYGFYQQEMNICNVPADHEAALQAIVSAYDEDALVTYTEASSGEMYYRVTQLEDVGDYGAIQIEVTATYPEATYEDMEEHLVGIQAERYDTAYGEIDLLTAEPDPDPAPTPDPEPPVATDTTTLSTGDLDGDGAITIQDAYQTLMAYANASAGLEDGLSEAQRKAVDVDGDGAVTIQDAYKILCYYADASAGLEPSWA